MRCVTGVKYNVTYIFSRECAVQFNAEDFHCGNIYKEEIL